MQKHIIMIDDDPDILESTGTMLKLSGYQVSCFNSFTNFEEIAALNADCFILDEYLPGVSGHIICIILKSKEVTRRIPVILISANPRLHDIAQLAEADASIEKPFGMENLLKLLATTIN